MDKKLQYYTVAYDVKLNYLSSTTDIHSTVLISVDYIQSLQRSTVQSSIAVF